MKQTAIDARHNHDGLLPQLPGKSVSLPRRQRGERRPSWLTCGLVAVMAILLLSTQRSTAAPGGDTDSLVGRICASRENVIEFFNQIKHGKDIGAEFCEPLTASCGVQNNESSTPALTTAGTNARTDGSDGKMVNRTIRQKCSPHPSSGNVSSVECTALMSHDQTLSVTCESAGGNVSTKVSSCETPKSKDEVSISCSALGSPAPAMVVKCKNRAGKCSESCGVKTGRLGIDYTDFRTYTEYARENGQMLSTMLAQMPLTSEILATHGSHTYSNLTCDQLGVRNFFTAGNRIFTIRARNAAQHKNVFAVGGCMGSGNYSNSECFYHYHSARTLDNPEELESYCLSHDQVPSVTDGAPPFFTIPKEWLKKQRKTGTGDAYLGDPCRQFCHGNSTLTSTMDHCNIPGNVSCPVLTRYSENLWVAPYYDCNLGLIWMITYGVPVAIYRNNDVHYYGMTAVDIDLETIPINQCLVESKGFQSVFANTHLCDSDTSVCTPVHGEGLQLRRGQYDCVCKRGFYYTDSHGNHSDRINGTYLETRTDKILKNSSGACNATVREQLNIYRCKPCHNRCRMCNNSADDCRYKPSQALILPFHVINTLAVLFNVALGIYVYVKRTEPAIRSASWQFLEIIIGGSVLVYVGLFAGSSPTKLHCVFSTWCLEMAMALSYGSILLKSWRIEQIFSTKSMVKPRSKPRLRNKDLGIYLCLMLFLFAVLLIIATASNILGTEVHEKEVDGKTFYYDICEESVYSYAAMAVHMAVLLPCCYFCFKLRRVLNDYAESREISLIVYFGVVIEIFVFVAHVLILKEETPEFHYLLRSIEVLILFTVMVAILLLPKVRRVHWPTLEELAMSKATSAQMRLMRSTSATAMQRRGTISLDIIHRDSIVDSSQQMTDPGGNCVIPVRYERRGSFYNMGSSKSSLQISAGLHSASSMDSLPVRSANSLSVEMPSPVMKKRRSASLALPTTTNLLLGRSYPNRSLSSSSQVGLSSGGSVTEEGLPLSLPSPPPLSPSLPTPLLPTNATGSIYLSNYEEPPLADVNFKERQTDSTSTRLTAAGIPTAVKRRQQRLATLETFVPPTIKVHASRCTDVMEVDESVGTSPPTPSLVITMSEPGSGSNGLEQATPSS